MAISNMKPGRAAGLSRRTHAGAGGERVTALLVSTGGPSLKAKSVAIVIRPKTLKEVAGQLGPMTTLIETYGAALEKSRLIGRSVRFVVDVGPRGDPKFTLIEGQARQIEETSAGEAESDDLESALTSARARGRIRVSEILSGDDMLSADKFAALIGTSRVTVNAKRQNCQILGLEGAKRGFKFPEWQVGEDGKPFAALPELFDRLGGSSWAVYRFLVQHHPELDGMTGREALQRGRSNKAVEAAESVARAFS